MRSIPGVLVSVRKLLIAHAAGKLPEPVALVVATHLALCPEARTRYRRYEALGGLLLDEIEPEPSLGDDWTRMLARLDAEEGTPLPGAQARCGTDARLPRPLRDYLPGTLDALRWRSYGTAAEVEIPIRAPGYKTSLIRVRAGRMVPQHTHEGHELTVVRAISSFSLSSPSDSTRSSSQSRSTVSVVFWSLRISP